MESSTLRPQSLAEYVGQTKLKHQLTVYCEDARMDHRPLPHVLLAAPPGFGKTSLASLIAAEVCDEFHMLTMPMKPAALLNFFNRFRGGVVLFDEFHRCSKSQQEDFLNPLEDGYFTTPNGRRVEIPWFTAVIATTERENIIAPVLRRIPIKNISFEDYSDEDLGHIVVGMAAKLGLTLTAELAEGLGRAAGGRPGEALELVYAARALSKRIYIGDTLQLEQVLEFCEIDSDGVTKDHRRLLTAIDKLAGLGAVGMDRLSDYIGFHESVVRNLERLLIDRGLISYGPGGRELTTTGIARVRGTAAPRQDAA